jgi:uncharacterized protein (DUF1786 family)
MLDIGAGTMDVLFSALDSGVHFNAVAKSPVVSVAETIESVRGDLLITGAEMGGGPVSEVLEKRAKHCRVTMSRSAAATIHHDMGRVRSLGIDVVEDGEAENLKNISSYSPLTIGDLEAVRIKQILEGLGAPSVFDVVGICLQDHGVPPKGVSHLDYRHQILKTRLEREPFPHAMLYRDDEVPSTLNRLASAARSARELSAREIYVMDSGMAAMLGASMDLTAMEKRRIIVLDVATSHTLGASLESGTLCGFFEYHTCDITLDRLESLIRGLADGKLKHEQILEEGGHGAYIRKAIGFQAVEAFVATGPKRRIVENSKIRMMMGAPLGDNMMTGTVGILEAIRRRKNLKKMRYL